MERVGKGRGVRDKGSEEFRKFVKEMDLVDFPLVGGKFN